MQLRITDGYITGYATVGGFPGGVEVPDDALDGLDPGALGLHCYRWKDGGAALDGDKLAAITAQRRAEEIRARREVECFPVVNRGGPWYTMLTREQLDELEAWYRAWLDAPATGSVPEPPGWIK